MKTKIETSNIKKICHECGKPLTVNPRSASSPGEVCRECFYKRLEAHKICHTCDDDTDIESSNIKTVKLSYTYEDTTYETEVDMCPKCLHRFFTTKGGN